MGDAKKVHPSENMAKDGGTEISLKEKEEKLESDFGQDEKKKEDEEKKPAEMVAYGDLFRYATGKDKLSLLIAIIAAIGTGASMPLMFIIFSQMTDSFTVVGGLGTCFNATSPNSTTFPNLFPMPDPTNNPPFVTTNDPDYCKDPTLSDKHCDFPGSSRSFVGVAALDVNETIADEYLCMCFDAETCMKVTGIDDEAELLDEYVYKALEGTLSILELMRPYAIFYTVFGIGTWLCGWIQTWFLMAQASNQMARIRAKFFDSVLRQDIGFFDTNSAGELNTRLADDIKKISDGMGDKIGITVQSIARFITGFVIAFIYGWKLALVIMSIFPVLMVSAIVMFKVTSSFTEKELDAYATAGGIAEEVLSGIKTVTAFSGQAEELVRYNKHLEVAKSVGIKKNVSTGFSLGTLFLVLFSAYGLGFWYGGKLIVGDGYTIGDVMLVFFAMLTGAFSLSAAGNNVEVFAKSRVAAFEIFKLIDRKSPIDPLSDTGKKLDTNIKPEITFKNVSFTYPAREDQQILFNVSFKAEVGKTLALCGQSGSGKSTCIQLIQRFYDAQEGGVYFGGVDIKTLNVKSLREEIGVVSQEPVLFDASIKENIRYGRLDVTDKEIYEAAKMANCFDFIERLPNQWNTQVGEGGATLSGGQKQRVAIARALVRNPKILLLDEATSALDTESEAIVQQALEKASVGRTTIVIAHRLSTIRNADKIIGFAGGKIVEEGTHESLLKKENGVYANLVNMQSFGDEKDKSKEEKTSKKALQSQKSVVDQKDKTEADEDEDLPQAPWTTILKMNGPEWPFLLCGSIFSAIVGIAQPLFAIIFADILSKVSSLEGEELEAAMAENAIKFVLLGVLNFVGNIGAISCFGKAGEELTLRIRSKAFEKYLRLHMSYFDDPMNSTGALTTRLSTDASRVQELSWKERRIQV